MRLDRGGQRGRRLRVDERLLCNRLAVREVGEGLAAVLLHGQLVARGESVHQRLGGAAVAQRLELLAVEGVAGGGDGARVG